MIVEFLIQYNVSIILFSFLGTLFLLFIIYHDFSLDSLFFKKTNLNNSSLLVDQNVSSCQALVNLPAENIHEINLDEPENILSSTEGPISQTEIDEFQFKRLSIHLDSHLIQPENSLNKMIENSNHIQDCSIQPENILMTLDLNISNSNLYMEYGPTTKELQAEETLKSLIDMNQVKTVDVFDMYFKGSLSYEEMVSQLKFRNAS